MSVIYQYQSEYLPRYHTIQFLYPLFVANNNKRERVVSFVRHPNSFRCRLYAAKYFMVVPTHRRSRNYLRRPLSPPVSPTLSISFLEISGGGDKLEESFLVSILNNFIYVRERSRVQYSTYLGHHTINLIPRRSNYVQKFNGTWSR